MAKSDPKHAPGDDGEGSVFMVLYDVGRLFRRDFHRRSRSQGTTRAQWQVLGTLARHEGIRQINLADLLEIEPITLVRLLDRLEEAGLVERRPDPTDRRARTLHLTPMARPVIEQIREIGMACSAVGLAGLSEVEQTELLRLLRRIRANLAERSAPAEDGAAPSARQKEGLQ
jgi:DNA-binding MarR family transcriptional regulator